MNRSLRRLGQLLVVMGVLLGAVLGAGLALVVENAETSRAAGPERAAVLAASPPSRQPPAPRAAGSPGPGNAGDSSGNQRARSADQRVKADQKGHDRRDKPAKAKGRDDPGKAKDR